jgi:hypothetical protein
MTTLIINKTFSYPSGATYHVRCEAVRSTEMNADCYRVLYSINGSYFKADGTPRLHEYHADYSLYANHRFVSSLDEAITITLYAVECVLDKREYFASASTPLQNVSRIMEWCRANRKLVHSAFASSILVSVPTVKIEVWRDNHATVSGAIQQWNQGVTILWTIRDYTPQSLFTGKFEKTDKPPTLAAIESAATGSNEDGRAA